VSTDYNIWADALILGIAVFALTIATFCLPHEGKRRGATPEPSRRKLEEHQAVRRILMEEGEFR
jgi:hypothetical protein